MKDAVSIRQRPAAVEDRAVPGHWEGDLLSGPNNTYIATLVEHQTRYVMLAKVAGKDTRTVVTALIKQAKKLPKELYKSLTWDRGKELTAHRRFTLATNIDVYFCDPQSPWQRGSNENTNGLLRQYFPQGTTLGLRVSAAGPTMKRREFIMLVGGTAAWSRAALAQPQALPTIGLLSARAPDESAHLVDAFRRGLAETGAVEGRNVAVEYRWALGEYDRLPVLAAELVRRPVTALVTVGGENSSMAAKAATATIPIVSLFTDDPVERGLVASLNRPGGNVTGISLLNGALEAKRLGLLREIVPKVATLGFLLNRSYPGAASQLRDMQEAARTIGLQLHVLNASTDPEIDTAFEAFARSGIPALVVAVDPFFVTRRDKLVALAMRHALPTMYSLREFAISGGLISYGVDLSDMYRLAGVYAGQILKGIKPADLPVIQPTKFVLVINLKTAKLLGLTLSSGLLSIADEVIE